MNSDASSHFNLIEAKRQETIEAINQLSKDSVILTSEKDLEDLEKRTQELTRKLGDLTVACNVQQCLDDAEFKKQGSVVVQACSIKRVCKGNRLVLICFAGGTQIELSASYWARKKFEGKRERGIYPELYLLGIHDRCSPLLASEGSQASVALGSFKEACNMLTSHGCVLDIKAVLRITKLLYWFIRLHKGMFAIF